MKLALTVINDVRIWIVEAELNWAI